MFEGLELCFWSVVLLADHKHPIPLWDELVDWLASGDREERWDVKEQQSQGMF